MKKDIDEKIVKQSNITFLEGYLWDKGDPQKAFNKAISSSHNQPCLFLICFVLKDIKNIFLIW